MYAKRLGIKHFRGVFMRDALPAQPRHHESAVINLDDSSGRGTHYVAYVKRGGKVWYYDSYGNLPPPSELAQYLGSSARIVYNKKREQSFHTRSCGRLCLKFLYNMQTQNHGS